MRSAAVAAASMGLCADALRVSGHRQGRAHSQTNNTDAPFWQFSGSHINFTALEEFRAWDREQGWTAEHREGVDYADEAAWPSLSTAEGGWDLGLNNPRAVVLSMKQRVERRHHFQELFKGVGWKLDAEWAAAIDGGKIPKHLRWLTGHVNPKYWDDDKPGNWGCYVSHLAIMLESHLKCESCDLVVFEDDAVFAPKFQERWDAFHAELPQDWEILRLGGQSLWEPSYSIKGSVVHARAVANTWGYVIKAGALAKLTQKLGALPIQGQWGIDAVLQLFAEEMPMYAPTTPLVYAVGECSDSSAQSPGHGCGRDDQDALQARLTNLVENWPNGYIRTYCVGKERIRDGHKADARCLNAETVGIAECCPYQDPPKINLNEM